MPPLLIAIIIGGIIGWLASILMKTDGQQGLLANIVVGMVGSSLGHWLAPKLGLGAGSEVGAWLVSIAGAVLLIYILKALGIFK